MEIGVFSFGDVQRENGKLGPTRDAITNLLEAIQLADKVGLDFFGVGEHHTEYFPASSPSTILAAAAATTKNIKLGSAVTVLSTETLFVPISNSQPPILLVGDELKLSPDVVLRQNHFHYLAIAFRITISCMLKSSISCCKSTP